MKLNSNIEGKHSPLKSLYVFIFLLTILTRYHLSDSLIKKQYSLSKAKLLSKSHNFNFDRGFTLIELLIVLLIIGIGFMSITPKLFENVVEPNKKVLFFNDLLNKYSKEAYEKGHPITLEGSKNTSKIIVRDEELDDTKKEKVTEIDIPYDTLMNNIEVNGEKFFSNKFSINIYPDKICDHFIINYNDDTAIESIPLLLKVSEVKPK
jgi:prepilin-type N-terminal cleavage/methylation domain-containing protein